MVWWFALALFVATTVIGELLRPKPKFDAPKASALGDFQVPTAEEGRPIPVPFGKCRVKGVNCTWYGDLKVVPIKKKVKTGLFSSQKIIQGYKYYLGMQLGLCHGEIDERGDIKFGDKKSTPTVTPVGDHDVLLFNDEQLFGGSENGREGGIKGKMDFYYGTTTQLGNAYLAGATGKPQPGYRTLCHAVLNQMYIGTSQYLKTIDFELSRYPNGLGMTGDKHKIGEDSNPFCALFDILTDGLWGDNIAAGNIDVPAFQACAETAYNEGLGISFLLDSLTNSDALGAEILRHVDGVMFTDPSTGLITVRLARADYDPDDLLLLDESNSDEAEFTRGSWDETINSVKIKFNDRDADYTERFIPVQNSANIQSRSGWVEPEEYDFTMFSNATTANKCAARVLKTVSYPLGRASLQANRVAYPLRPGSVVKYSRIRHQISNLVMRVASIDYGQIRDGKIRLDLVEDIFGVSFAAYDPPPPSEWVKPTFEAQVPAATRIWEVPYQVAEDKTGQQVAVMAVRPNGVHTSYDVLSDEVDPLGTLPEDFTTSNADVPFTPSGLLVGAIAEDRPYSGESMTFDNVSGLEDFVDHVLDDLDTEAVNLFIIDDEVFFFEGITDNGDGSWTVDNVRSGMMYSIPAAHADNSRAWFFSGGIGLVKEGVYPVDKDIRVKLVTKTVVEVLDFASAPTLDYTVVGVINGPYPPNDVKINGARLFDITTTVGLLAITWKGRNTRGPLKTDQDDAHATPDGGTGFSLVLRRGDDLTALRTLTRVPAAPAGGAYNAFGYVPEVSPGVPLSSYRLELWSERGGQTSQVWLHDFNIKGYGFDYGGTQTESPDLIGYGGSLTPGAVAVRGAAPPTIEPLPGLDVQNSLTIQFGGTFPDPIALKGFANGKWYGRVGGFGLESQPSAESSNGLDWTVHAPGAYRLDSLVYGPTGKYHAVVGNNDLGVSDTGDIYGTWTFVTQSGGAWRKLKVMNSLLFALHNAPYEDFALATSNDGGASWSLVVHDLPMTFRVVDMMYDTTNARYLAFGYLETETSPGVFTFEAKVYESADFTAYTLLNDFAADLSSTQLLLKNIAFNPSTGAIIAALTDTGALVLAHSTDWGNTWTYPSITWPTTVPATVFLGLVWDGVQFLAGGRDFVGRSADGATGWVFEENIFGFSEQFGLMFTNGGGRTVATAVTATTFRAVTTGNGADWESTGLPTDSFTISLTQFPFDGSPAHSETYTLDAAGIATLGQLASKLSLLVLADFPEFSVVLNGGAVTFTTLEGTLYATYFNDTASVYFTVDQAPSAATPGAAHIATIDFKQMVNNPFPPPSQIEGPSDTVSDKYNSGGSIILRLGINGLTFDTRQALGISGSIERVIVFDNGSSFGAAGQYTLPLDGMGGLFPSSKDLHRVLDNDSVLGQYIQSVQFTQMSAPFVTFPAPRPGIAVTMKPNYSLTEMFYETTESNVGGTLPPFKCLVKTNRRGLPAYPTGAAKIVTVNFTTGYGPGGPLQSIQVGQVYFVELAGVRYQTVVEAGDLADDPYRDAIFNRLKTAIEAGPYTVTFNTLLRSPGGATFIASMRIQHTAVNTDFTVEAAASFGLEISIF